jgi:mannose-6-phosphate isomerase-like protein (cupin superfamily)
MREVKFQKNYVEKCYYQQLKNKFYNMISKPKKVDKLWGHELWIHNDSQYCGKLLVFPEKGNHFSMHYHMIKNETWYIQEGEFQFDWIDTDNAKLFRKTLYKGDVVYIERGKPHQLTALEDNSVVFEVSTEHFDYDSYRVYRNSLLELDEDINYV